MRPSLHLNVSQQHSLTPQLQQTIRLLQLSTLALRQEIQRQVDSNPMLELLSNETDKADSLEDTVSMPDELNDFQWSNLYTHSNAYPDENSYEKGYATPLTLQDHLRWQLELTPCSAFDKAIGLAIIDAINDDGFLTLSLTELKNSFTSDSTRLSLAEIEAVRHLIQRFDPVGCGASNLAEVLLLQLEQLPENTPHLSLAMNILRDNIQALGKHNYRQLMNLYHVDKSSLNEVIHLIQSLHPKPGMLFDVSKPEAWTPDLVVKKVGQRWKVDLNPLSLPRLHIHHYYSSLIKRTTNNRDSQFLKTNLQEARWFLKNIQNRQETLLKVARYVVEYQQDFFVFGDEAMKPLILNDVAEALKLHESTVSRVTTQKYIHTPRGLFELKYFFSSHVPTIIGEECSSTAIRAVIKKMISREDHTAPLSDNQMATLMHQQGIQVARRTVTKYRETMGIAPSYERKLISC